MYEVCRSRATWIFHLQNLDINQTPRFAPFEQLEALSTEEIRERVIRAIRTSRNWAAPTILSITTLATLHLSPRVLPDRITFPTRLKPEIVAGGEYIITENKGYIELWSIRASERLWASPTPGGSLFCHSFVSELQQHGEILAVAAAYVNLTTGKR